MCIETVLSINPNEIKITYDYMILYNFEKNIFSNHLFKKGYFVAEDKAIVSLPSLFLFGISNH